MDNKQSTNEPITSKINSGSTTHDNDEKGLDGTFVVINPEDLGGQGVANRSLNDRLLIVESENRELAFNVNVLQDRLNQQTACLSIVQQRNAQLEKSLAEITELKDSYEQRLKALHKGMIEHNQLINEQLELVRTNAFDITQHPLPEVPPPFNIEDLSDISSQPDSPRGIDTTDDDISSNASETEPTSLVTNTSLNLSHDNGNKTINRG